ncbi:hypothetical protein [Listeria monocytogenes]|uniref:hypothetical protein n=1 Tax=Listeria monocytogenes TaxID=1639 RepID=UPI0002593D39|nr:hypothetical protein [Listeria monocytogenes]AFH78661.1 hypothetical protein MUO_00390 [Listeria monocytogenes 07PF0776]
MAKDFSKTPTEKKQDEYDKLHDYLKDALKKHDEKMAEVKSDLSAYKKGMPDKKVLEQLEKYIDKEKDKRASLKSAIDKAYRKYLEYKALAIKEEKAEQAKKEKEKKEREERLKNG